MGRKNLGIHNVQKNNDIREDDSPHHLALVGVLNGKNNRYNHRSYAFQFRNHYVCILVQQGK